MNTKRVCIVGTAETWNKAPFADPSIEIWALNDAYCLNIPRADRWFELHPLDKMYFRPRDRKVILGKDIPEGFFVRPDGHLAWLKQFAITNKVYLQAEPDASWPKNAMRFPIEQVEAEFGPYWASGPAYMVALAILEGYTEIQVYGIHLATDAEYRLQRPNFEHLLGIARGRGITVLMADGSPVMRHPWRYAYDDKPAPQVHPYQDEWSAVQKEKKALIKALVDWPKGQDPTRARARLKRLEVIEMDIQQQLAKRSMGGTLAITIAA